MAPRTALVDIFGPLVNIERLSPFKDIENARPMQAKELAFALNERRCKPYGTEWTSPRVYEFILKGLSNRTRLARCVGISERHAIAALLAEGLNVYAVTTIPHRRIQKLLRGFIERQWGGKVKMIVKPNDAHRPATSFKKFRKWLDGQRQPVIALVDSHWPFLARATAAEMFGPRLRICTKVCPLEPTVADLRSIAKDSGQDVANLSRQVQLAWPNTLATEDEKTRNLESYKECFWQALRRMAVVLNSSRFFKLCSYSWLRHSDAFIAYVFRQAELDEALLELNFDRLNPRRPEKELANNYFYGIWKFHDRPGFPRHKDGHTYSSATIEHRVRGAFYEWGHETLSAPAWPRAELYMGSFGDGSYFVSECATSNLLANFWHNFVHNRFQGITDANYSLFGGEPRYDSDLEADNLANVFLVYSYGRPVLTDGRIRRHDQVSIEGLFKRAACSKLFLKRAAIRTHQIEISSDREALEEYEWQFRRRVGNYVSRTLLAQGLAVYEVKVLLTGSEWKRARGSKLFWRRNSRVVVVLNGRRIHTTVNLVVLPKRVRAIRQNRTSDDRTEQDVRKVQLRVSQDVATIAVTGYREILEERGFKAFARGSLGALMDRFGINLAASQEL